MPDATLMIVRDEADNPRCVVTHADDVIWVADDLWASLLDPNRQRIPGDAELDGDLLSFGTEGEGLGRFTYRRIGEHVDPYGRCFVVCKRIQPTTEETA